MKITIVSGRSGDWVRLYVDGKLRKDYHYIDESDFVDLLRELGAEVKEHVVHDSWFYKNTGQSLDENNLS